MYPHQHQRFLSTPARPGGNALRITDALTVMARVMNGATPPDPAETAPVSGEPLDAAQMHRAGAVALREALLTRRARHGSLARRRSPALDAYYLSLALAADADGDHTGLDQIVAREGRSILTAASAVGRLQMRLLVSLVSQVDVTAVRPAEAESLADIDAAELVGRPAAVDRITVLGDHTCTGDDAEGFGDWLRATSTVTVSEFDHRVVVDAGPSLAPASEAITLASPVVVTPAEGLWPTETVGQCLRMCHEQVAAWVESMSRQLCPDSPGDLLLGDPFGPAGHLVTPAARQVAAALRRVREHRPPGERDAPAVVGAPVAGVLGRTDHNTVRTARQRQERVRERIDAHRETLRAAAEDLAETETVDPVRSPRAARREAERMGDAARALATRTGELAEMIDELTGLRAADRDAAAARRSLREAMWVRRGALPPDEAVPDPCPKAARRGAESAMLAELPDAPLPEPVTVTANITVDDHDPLAVEFETGDVTVLRSPVLGLVNRSVVSGRSLRLTLRVRARTGLAVRTRSGDGVVLSPGSRFEVLAHRRRGEHLTVLLDQCTDRMSGDGSGDGSGDLDGTGTVAAREDDGPGDGHRAGRVVA